MRASPDAPDGFPFEEKNARHLAGLTKDEMRAWRQKHFTLAVDFILHKKRIFLSTAGVEKLRTATGQPPAAKTSYTKRTDDPDTAKSAVTKKTAAPAVVTVRVMRPTRNPHIVHVCADDDNPDAPRRVLRLRVRSAERFVRRMAVPALLADGYDDLYDVAGPYPRKKGVW